MNKNKPIKTKKKTSLLLLLKKRTYTKKDYYSNDGMLTTVWGPGIWHFLHTMSFNYPVFPTNEDKQKYRNFILSLGGILPCGKCRNNLKRNLKKYPLKMKYMYSRDTFSRYIYKLHEVVNKMLGKKSGLSYDDVRERYEHFRARCVDTSQKDTPVNNEFSRNSNDGNVLVKKEDGCVEPLYGEKSKCLLHIVPINKKCDTLTIDEKCIKKRLIPITA